MNTSDFLAAGIAFGVTLGTVLYVMPAPTPAEQIVTTREATDEEVARFWSRRAQAEVKPVATSREECSWAVYKDTVIGSLDGDGIVCVVNLAVTAARARDWSRCTALLANASASWENLPYAIQLDQQAAKGEIDRLGSACMTKSFGG